MGIHHGIAASPSSKLVFLPRNFTTSLKSGKNSAVFVLKKQASLLCKVVETIK